MFYCQNCAKLVGRNQPENKVVVAWRPVEYRTQTYRGQEVVSTGKEIVQEIRTCPKCYLALTGKEPVVVSNREYQAPVRASDKKPGVVEVTRPLKVERD